ncbi:glycine zipper family protein [Haloferax sp. S1W]|uniref:glycine zipper family protein n=1 Tax=Haloferax sp. S1W TaxID=3377110 RepID=UPI0037C7C12E
MTSLTGLASANGSDEEETVEVRIDTAVENGTKYAVSIARNKTTKEVDGTILPVPVDEDNRIKKDDDSNSDNLTMYGISDDILSEIQPSVFNEEESRANDEGTTISQTDSKQSDIWGPLRDVAKQSSSNSKIATTQEEGLLESVVKEIAAGTKESINRLGVYYIESPEGADCDATKNKNLHRQFCGSIDYEKSLGEFTEVIVSGTLGAIVGAAISGGVGAGIGTIVGGIAGFAIKELKDTTNASFVFRDIDKCAFGACAPVVKPYVSGIWMDEDEDLLSIDVGEIRDFPGAHLENGASIPTGYRDVYKISD